jgi:hypothetical protein
MLCCAAQSPMACVRWDTAEDGWMREAVLVRMLGSSWFHRSLVHWRYGRIDRVRDLRTQKSLPCAWGATRP